ncbi:SH3 domain-containing protein [Syntrophomonas palmitatica]|uniref:SH3 domain-containing protein n=1 Tax=Syntrophomonas palmitatica TaxID=402877 RepID=UPI0006CFC908|nr:SH3 domain-containing protein [Syntrophomonas palmitatica]
MLDSGTICQVVSKEGDWYKVKLSSGQTGYIASWLVKETTAASNSAPAAAPDKAANASSNSTSAPVVNLDGENLVI